MDPMDKIILSSLYLTRLEPGISSFNRIRSRIPIDKKFYESKVSILERRGLVEKYNDESKLTFIGRDAIKVFLFFVVFDLI